MIDYLRTDTILELRLVVLDGPDVETRMAGCRWMRALDLLSNAAQSLPQ